MDDSLWTLILILCFHQEHRDGGGVESDGGRAQRPRQVRAEFPLHGERRTAQPVRRRAARLRGQRGLRKQGRLPRAGALQVCSGVLRVQYRERLNQAC